ncbi:hypothetical protein ACOZB2_12315, partial [Pantoea endophytica]
NSLISQVNWLAFHPVRKKPLQSISIGPGLFSPLRNAMMAAVLQTNPYANENEYVEKTVIPSAGCFYFGRLCQQQHHIGYSTEDSITAARSKPDGRHHQR